MNFLIAKDNLAVTQRRRHLTPITPPSFNTSSQLRIHMENARRGVTENINPGKEKRIISPPSSLRYKLNHKKKSPDDDLSSSTTLSDRENKSITKSSRRSIPQNDAQLKRKTNSSLKSLTENVNPKRPSSNSNSSDVGLIENKNSPNIIRNGVKPDRKTLSLKVNETSRRMDSLKQLTNSTLSRIDQLKAAKTGAKKDLVDINKTTEVVRNISPGAQCQVPKASTSQETENTAPEVVKPVSILKRKTSQEEGSSIQAPVTFSPCVVDPPTCGLRRQGILKKRRSLDESEVIRRRSCSPDITIIEGTSTDFKPILKQRRSSLEDLRIGTSPEPQSILKRKTSRAEDDNSVEDRSIVGSPEPQSILKRKSGSNSSGSSSNGSQHVSITAAVILAAVGGAEVIYDNDSVRPILKKKSLDDSNSNLSYDDSNLVPRPILKKKCSTDTDDYEDKPKKTILKQTRNSGSIQDNDSETMPKGMLRNHRSPESSSFESTLSSSSPSRKVSSCRVDSDVRPILKISRDSSPRSQPGLDEDDLNSLSQSAVLDSDCLRRSLTGMSPILRTRSSGAEYEGVYRRRSLQLVDQNQHMDEINERVRHQSLSDMSDPREGCLPSTSSNFGVSVAERIMRMESVLANENTTKNNGFVNGNSFIQIRRGSWRGSQEFDRSSKSQQSDQARTELTPSPNKSILERSQEPLSSSCYSQNGGETTSLLHPKQQNASFASQSEQFNSANFSTDLTSENSILLNSIINLNTSCIDSGINLTESYKMSSSSETKNEETVESSRTPTPENLDERPRRNSVAARAAALNKQCEEQKKTKVNPGIERIKFRNANRFSASNRFSTQPVTLSEMEQAVKQNESNTDNDVDENDPSKLTLAERVKLFNKKVTEEGESKSLHLPPNPPPTRKRYSRYKTQPITSNEVETAQKMNPLMATFIKTPDPKELQGLSIKETKEKMHQHAVKMLTNEVKGILKSKSFVSPIKSSNSCNKPVDPHRASPTKSMLKKNSSDEKSDTEQSGSGSKSNLSFLRSILKSESLEKQDRDCDKDLVSEKSDSDVISSYCNKIDKLRFSSSSSSEGESSGGREVNSIIKSEVRTKQRLPQSADQHSGDKNLLHKSKSNTKVGYNNESVDLLQNEEKKATIITSNLKSQPELSLVYNKENIDTGDSSCSDDNTEQPNKQAVPPISRRLCTVRRSKTTSDMPASSDDVTDRSSAVSIAERRAALQNSGNNDWKRRVIPINKLAENELKNITSANNLINVESSKHEERSTEIITSTKLSDVVSKLETASHGWKKRVEQSDVEKFTVEGRMRHKGEDVSTLQSLPIMSLNGCKEKRTPKPIRFKTKTEREDENEKTISMGLKRSISAPSTGKEDASNSFSEKGLTVSVPRPDDETFTSFYTSVTSSQHSESITESVTTEDLNAITRSSQEKLLGQKRHIVIRRKHGTSRNPIKSLNARTDIRTEYTEIKTGIAEKELTRMKVEKLSKQSHLAVAALAGLASKEDFTAVNLKKTNTATSTTFSMLPHNDLMLIHVKGRRHVQARLVEPVTSSINRGDTYVLVTKNQIYNYQGLYSNVIEQSRSTEIAAATALSGNKEIITIKEESPCPPKYLDDFWALLGHSEKSNSPKLAEAGHPDEDEIFESKIIDTNMVYVLENDELIPDRSYWGCIPKIEMLDPSKILVFDFGTELYVWNGKNSSLDRRKLAVKLAKDLWQEGYDYTDCDICPLNATQMLGARDTFIEPTKKGTTRPSWALLAKVTQNMEPILFREKFLDWPDYSRVIRVKEQESPDKSQPLIKAIDVAEMVKSNKNHPNLILEGSQLGRGNKYFDEETNRVFEITTVDVKKWHIQEFECFEMDPFELNQFYSGDNFIIRWQYIVAVTGREFTGKPSRHSLAGRDRCAYFCWQGKNASLNEKGAAALLTVQLDEERGPQIRVTQGSETPAFLNLFNGGMIIHEGKRFTENDNNNTPKPWQLYFCKGDHKNEAFLTEVACNMRQLRSRASMIFLNENTAVIIVWHGAKSLPNSQEIAKSAAKKLGTYLEKKLLKSFSVTDVTEGNETVELLKVLGASSGRQLYSSLMDSNATCTETPRLFHFTSINGVFEANEILCPYGTEETNIVNPYPFSQLDLYSASQPTIFLFDDKETLWLWQGWWPELNSDSDRDSPTDQTGSWVKRWQEERRSAMETTINYWKEKYTSQNTDDRECPAVLVWAGLEPLEFTNLFPTWTDRDDVTEINIRDGRKPGEMLSLNSEIARLTCCTYPAPALLQRPLPDGVDPTMLEKYLSPTHFTQMFQGLTKEEFYQLPQWKQTNLKKNSGLF